MKCYKIFQKARHHVTLDQRHKVNFMKKLFAFTAIGTIMICSNAHASGFNLKEQSAAAQGNAFAGATAGAEDISYSYFNPAGLTRHKGTKMSAGGTWIAPRSKAKTAKAVNPITGADETSYTGDIVHAAVSPNFYISHQFDPQWTAAVSVNTPYGMITTYDDDWAGRFHGTKSDVKTLTVTPMLAYKAADKLSLGAGFQMQYIRAKLSNAQITQDMLGRPQEDHTKLQGDTLDIGYSLGALYEHSDATRFGVGYRSQVKHKLKGSIDFSKAVFMDQDINARLTTPANLTFGAYHDLNDQWSLMAEFGRTYWSSFEELRIKGENQGRLGINSVTQEKWKDTTFYALGASYRYNEKLKFRAGIAVDQGAVGEAYRTPRIPDADRMWYSGGIEYALNEKMTLNFAYTYIRAEKGHVNLDGRHDGDTLRGSLRARYENDIHIAAMGINYNF